MVALNDSFPDPDNGDQEHRELIRKVAQLVLSGQLQRIYEPELGGWLELLVGVRNKNLWGMRKRPPQTGELIEDVERPNRQLKLFDPSDN